MANANVKEFNSDNWESEVIKSSEPVLVDFWAPWCGPCRMIAPTIDKIANNYTGKVKVGKLNVDDAQDVAARYGISSIPAVLIFKGNGGNEPIERIVGARPEGEFTKVIDRVLGA